MKWKWLFIFMLLLPAASAISYPRLGGYVTDSADMIEPSYEARITQLAGALEKETTVQVAVVTVESLDGESIEMYAVNLFEKAGIGRKDKDNGLLIFIAKKERECRFEVGYGLEGTITDSMKVNIGNRIIEPNFRNGEYGKGIYESLLVIKELVRGNPEVVSQYGIKQSGGSSEDLSALFVIIFFLIVGLIVFIYIMNTTYNRDTSGRRRQGHIDPVPRTGRGWGGGWHWQGGGFGGGFGGGRSGGGGFGGGFGGFGGGRSGGGGFGVKW